MVRFEEDIVRGAVWLRREGGCCILESGVVVVVSLES
jgi:hypothetical protein